MIVWIARGLTRIVALLVLIVLAIASLAVSVAVAAGAGRTADALSSLGVTDAWRSVGDALGGGTLDTQTVAIAGAIALAAGLILLVGSLVPRKDRDIPLKDDSTLAVRRRALRQAVGHLAEDAPGVSDAKVRLRLRRLRHGGRVRVRAGRVARGDGAAVKAAVRERVQPVATALGLHARVRDAVADSRKAALR